MRYDELLNERFINLIGKDSQTLRNVYRDQVWDILQKSYASIGGIKGSGFRSPEDLDNNPFWKLVVRNNKVHAVIIYKDKSGRKSVAIGSDGSDYAKKHLTSVLINDLSRSYSEKSKAALGFLFKTVSWDILKEYIKTPKEASKILRKDVIPIIDMPKEQWPIDAQITLAKYPKLLPYGYIREINGSSIFKVMTGTPAITIT